MHMHIIDRRRDPDGKSLANRQRFIRRARALVRQAVQGGFGQIAASRSGARRRDTVPAGGVREPSLQARRRGRASANTCCPATRNTSPATGSRGRRPARQVERGRRRRGRGRFPLRAVGRGVPRLFFEDLELPDLAKRQLKGRKRLSPGGPGFALRARPRRFDLTNDAQEPASRRIALGQAAPLRDRKLRARLQVLEESGDDQETIAAPRAGARASGAPQRSSSPTSTPST